MTVDSSVAQPMPGVGDEGWSFRYVLSLISLVVAAEVLAASYLMVSTALPLIGKEFHTTQTSWMLTAFLLVGSVTSPLVGKLADTHGKRKLLVITMGITILGALISALASSYFLMLIGRGMSGFFTASIFLSYSLIRDVYPPRIVPMAVAIVTSGMGVVSVGLPFLSGWLIDHFGFRSVFWLTAGALSVVVVLIVLTTAESTARLRGKIDPIGAILLGGGVGCILVAISFGGVWGWMSASVLGYFAGGLVLLVAWLISAHFLSEPLIDIALLAHPPVVFTALAAGFCQAAVTGFAVILPLMVMTPLIPGMDLGYGFGTDTSGVALFQAPQGFGMMLGGLAVGYLVGRKVKPRLTMISGGLLWITGAVMLAFFHESQALVILFGVFAGLATGVCFASTPNLQIEAVPPQLQASTASIVTVGNNMLAGVIPVVLLAVMNANIVLEVDGGVVYSNSAITYGWLIVAGVGLLLTISALLLPRKIETVKLLSNLDVSPAMTRSS